MRRRLLLVACAAAGTALATAGAAAGGNGGAAPPTPRSPNAEGISDLYWVLLGISAAIFVLVQGALLVFVFRFRGRQRGREVDGPQIRGHTRLELIWTVIPVLILAAIAGFTFYKLPGIKNVPEARAGADRVAIGVEGHQYYWQFRYPNGVVSVDRLRVPVDRVVTLELTAPDVAHSWWVPELGGKLDTIPGKTNRTWFRAERTGTYAGKCGEFCGVQHAAMLAQVEVVTQEEFDRWLERRRRSTAELGRETFEGACGKCHGPRGEGDIGPPIAGVQLQRRALARIIRQGTGLMPAVGRDWDEPQVNAVIEHLQERVRNGGAGGGGG